MRKAPFFILCIVLTLAFTGVFFIPHNTAAKTTENKEKLYLELWHADTFEGGTGSRSAFLSKISKDYEKKCGVCVTVKSLTTHGISKLFSDGVFPDMLSFGNGTELPYEMLRKVGDKPYEYAIPWCMGGYVRIVRKGVKPERTIIAVQQNVFPTIAALLSGCKGQTTEIESTSAIYEFYKDKTAEIIGTQRDLYRLENKGMDIEVEPLCGYNDLYQYISVIADNDKKAVAAVGFCRYLLSQTVQTDLGKIGMLSAFYTVGESLVGEIGGVKYDYTTYPLLKNDDLEKLRRLSAMGEGSRKDIIAMLKRSA